MKKRKLTNNIHLKIMSLAVGILVWLLVVNIDNPIETKTFIVQNANLLNSDYIESITGKMLLTEENQAPVRVYITGERKTLEGINPASDIQVVADLQQAQSTETDPVMVPYVATCTGIASANIKVVPQNLSVHLQEKATQEFTITPSVGDSKPGKGYEIGSLSVNPEKIKITGPKDLVGKIDNVSAVVNVDGITENTTQQTELIVTDKNGDQLDSELDNLRFDRKVSVSVRLWKIRTDVKIEAGYVGVPAEGYYVDADTVTTVPDVISVAGSQEALDELEGMGNTIWVPADYMDISGDNSDQEKKINITELLPDGLKLTSGSSEDVWVRVSILPEDSEAYEFSTADIEIRNLSKGMQAVFATAVLEIRVKKTEQGLEALDPKEDIKASVNLEDKEAGSYEVPVEIELPEGYELVKDEQAEIKISEISSVEESGE